MIKIDNTYLGFSENLKNINDIYSSFKGELFFKDILEHVSVQFGLEYKQLIETEFKRCIEEFADLIKINDSIGNPSKFTMDNLCISPSNLRYIYHSLLIESKIKRWFNKKEIKIVEIGGGYGGLCYYIKNIIKDYHINYTIVDLPNIINLQSKFLNDVQVDSKLISCFDTTNINETFDLVISNYCLSEISMENRLYYLNNLVNKCEKEFYVWNSRSFEELNLNKYHIEDERPQTNYEQYNKYIFSI
jgi:hypothetical protein